MMTENQENDSQVDNRDNGELDNVIHQLTTELNGGRGIKASRRFLENQQEGLIPRTDELNWLVKKMGIKRTRQLVSAFAHFPCFYCKKGIVKCENCGGKGHIDHDLICEPCLGLGGVNCKFCDATGWVSLDYVPKGLRLAVVKIRTQTAVQRIRKLLKKPVPEPTLETASTIYKKLVQELVYLNRYLGVLENTLVYVDLVPDDKESERDATDKKDEIIHSCHQTALPAWTRLHECLQGMADSVRLITEDHTAEEEEKSLARTRVKFYQSLHDSSKDFSGTDWEHPFLNDAIQKILADKSEPKNKLKPEQENGITRNKQPV